MKIAKKVRTMTSLEQIIKNKQKKEREDYEKEQNSLRERRKKEPTIEVICRTMFPSIFEGRWQPSDTGYNGILFYVNGTAYSIVKEWHRDEGTLSEGYGPSEGYILVLSRGWNIKHLFSFSIASEYSEKTEQDLADYIKRDLERTGY